METKIQTDPHVNFSNGAHQAAAKAEVKAKATPLASSPQNQQPNLFRPQEQEADTQHH